MESGRGRSVPAIPQPDSHWVEADTSERYPHEYVPGGTAKLLCLFPPSTGEVRVQVVFGATNAVLHLRVEEQVLEILATLPPGARRRTGRSGRAGRQGFRCASRSCTS